MPSPEASTSPSVIWLSSMCNSHSKRELLYGVGTPFLRNLTSPYLPANFPYICLRFSPALRRKNYRQTPFIATWHSDRNGPTWRTTTKVYELERSYTNIACSCSSEGNECNWDADAAALLSGSRSLKRQRADAASRG